MPCSDWDSTAGTVVASSASFSHRLPCETDESADVAHEVEARCLVSPNQSMQMIGHAVHSAYQFLILLADDTSDVLLDLLFVIRLNQALSALNGEDNLNIDLGVGVGHVEPGYSPSNIPLHWSGERFLSRRRL